MKRCRRPCGALFYFTHRGQEKGEGWLRGGGPYVEGVLLGGGVTVTFGDFDWRSWSF